jgi:hypothetical protein
MSDDMLDQRGFVDVWSRLLAIGSLILAGVTLYWNYLYSQDQIRPADLEGKISSQVSSATQDLNARLVKQEENLQNLSLDMRGELARLQSDVSQLAQAASKPTDLNPTESRTADSSERDASSAMDQLGASSPPPIPDGSPAIRDSDGVLEDGPAGGEITPETRSASLVAVFTARRPIDAWDRPAISIRNTGDLSARISKVEFIPKRVVESVPKEVYSEKLPTTNDLRASILFTRIDNTSKKTTANGETYHGKYEHPMFSSLVIEPNADREIMLAIEDEDYASFGFEGLLVVHFNGQEKVEFQNVVVPFVAPQ